MNDIDVTREVLRSKRLIAQSVRLVESVRQTLDRGRNILQVVVLQRTLNRMMASKRSASRFLPPK